MKYIFQCQKHPKASLVQLHNAASGEHRYICARCSTIISGGIGTVGRLNYTGGTGEILLGKRKRPLVFLLADLRNMRPWPGQQVIYESSVAGDGETGSYLPAAVNIRPVLNDW